MAMYLTPAQVFFVEIQLIRILIWIVLAQLGAPQ